MLVSAPVPRRRLRRQAPGPLEATAPGGGRLGVVGGGIVGLAVARALLLARPGTGLVLFEKEDRLAAHQSGHNSGVVHAGLYYAPGSLKAALCRRGGAMLREYCAERAVRIDELGKLVVALDDEERERLRAIEARARENGVPDLAWLEGGAIAEIEPHAAGVAALHSPHSAVVDFAAVARCLAEDVVALGGEIRLGAAVSAATVEADGVRLLAGGRWERFSRAVVCAGLSSDHLARRAGGRRDVATVPFRGEYYALAKEAASRVRGLIYPVPDPRYPFLGVHLTRRVDGSVLAGPNAVLALAYEGYGWGDVSLRDLAHIGAFPGTWRLFARHWRTGVHELRLSLSKAAYLHAVRAYLPSLQASDLEAAPSGVRAQAVDRSGRLLDDFVIEAHGALMLVRNAPSPAATSSLAIAEHLSGLLLSG